MKKNKLGVGVDIGSRRIKLAVLRSTGKGVVVERVATKDLPHDAIVDGAVMDSPMVCGKIAELLSENRVSSKPAAISVGGRQLMIKRIQTDQMSDNELASAIEYEASQNLPFNVNEMTYDYERLDQDEDTSRMDILLVAAKNEVVFDAVETFRWAGGKAALLEGEPFALQAALTQSGYLDEEGATAVLQVGFQSTDVTIFNYMQYDSSRNLSIGGKTYVEAILRELGVTFERASSILASTHRTEEEQDVLERAARKIANRLAEQVEKSFPESFGVLADKPVVKIVLCGGGADLPALESALRQKFGVEVDIANPFRNLDVDPKSAQLLEPRTNSQYTGAIGLALRSMGETQTGFNLLFAADRPEAKRAAYIGAGTVIPIVGLSSILLGMAIVHISQENRLNLLDEKLQTIRAETDLYRDKIAVVEELTRKRADVAARIDVITGLDKNRFARVKVLQLVNDNVPSLTWITEVKEATGAGSGAALISGVTSSNIKVAEFMTSLLQNSQVRAVDILVSQQGEIAGTEVTTFTLQATIPTLYMETAVKPKPADLLARGAKAIRDKRADEDKLKEEAKH